MDMTGTHAIPAPREVVWLALNDPNVLKTCIPGCDSLTMRSATEFDAAVTAKVGPVKARFTGRVNLSDIAPPTGYRITGEGSGGVAGFAKGGATVRLVEDGRHTILTYEARAQVGGKIAQIGSRLIDAFARKMADEFFAAFARQLTAEASGRASGDAHSPTATAESPGAVARRVPLGQATGRWLRRFFRRTPEPGRG